MEDVAPRSKSQSELHLFHSLSLSSLSLSHSPLSLSLGARTRLLGFNKARIALPPSLSLPAYSLPTHLHHLPPLGTLSLTTLSLTTCMRAALLFACTHVWLADKFAVFDLRSDDAHPKTIHEAGEKGNVNFIMRQVERTIDFDINQRVRTFGLLEFQPLCVR